MSSLTSHSVYTNLVLFLVATDLVAFFPELSLYDFVFLVEVELAYIHGNKKDIYIFHFRLVPTMNYQVRGVFHN